MKSSSRISTVVVRVVHRSPKIENFAKSTPRAGGRYLFRRKTRNAEEHDIKDVIRAAALKWNYPPFDRLYPLGERIQEGLLAVLQNFDKISAAQNPLGMAYTIVHNTLNRLYRDEFSGGRPRQQQFISDCRDEIGAVEFGCTGSSFQLAACPDAISQMYSENRRLQFDEEFQRLLGKLPAAMSRLEPIEREIVRLYYGFGDQPLTIRQVGHAINKSIGRVHAHIQEAIRKLRHSLAIPGAAQPQRRR